MWTWTAIDPDTKLMVTWLVGERDEVDGLSFMLDLRERVSGRIQLSTDAGIPDRGIVERAFGSDIDYAPVIKDYGVESSEDGSPTDRRYRPNKVKSIEIRKINGDPDEDHITTSHVERMNLTIRMGMRRYTRLTNAFSKKVENLSHAVTIQFMYYNFARRTRRSARTRRPRWLLASATMFGRFRRSSVCSTKQVYLQYGLSTWGAVTDA